MVDRRTVLLSGLAAASAGLPFRLFAQPGFSVDDFVALSASLTGVPASMLNWEVAQLMHAAFDERGLLPGLARLANQNEADRAESQLGDEVVAAWYSGVLQTAKGPVVATHTSALVWANSSFMNPPGVCGDAPTGYWGDPPAV